VDRGGTNLVGRTLAHYRISTAIGAGGMGEVYRATDTKLVREVALKVLPPAMANDPDRLARFQREARAVASLNHPNVVTVYSVEESDDLHFITMELIDGQSLDRLISANGLPSDRIVEIAAAVAEALAAAHEKGIVHRDLKPANVMVTNEGRVKVLDFGLAKDVGAETANGATMASAGYTQAGMVMGTPAYMSPEQVSGRPLDHRSDIFSFGVMLHEMATGRRPFEGNSSAELISSILRDNPPSVTDIRPELSSDIARVIRRCLEKEPRHRVQTARDVSNEFRDLARTATRPAPVSTSSARTMVAADSSATRADEGFWVAVLPFKYSGGNQDLKALAEGLSEEMVTGLCRFSYLRVIARASTAKYSSESGDVRAIGREMGARYVMEGSLRQAGAKVRIAVQLVDATTGASLWAETYDRTFTPEAALDLLDDVVPRMVATVGDTQGILAHSMTEALRNRDPESLTPHEALLRSFGFHQHVSAAEHLAGREALEHAVNVAPDRAECWAMLSWLYRAEYTHAYNALPDPMDRALAAAQRAVNLAPSNQLAQAALASALFFRRELGAFRSAAERALALNHMEGYTTAFTAMQFAFSGDWERGCALSERSTQLNPHHPGWYWFPQVINAYRQHDGQQALEYLLKINMPGLWTAQVANAVVYSQIGEMDRARTAVRELLAIRPDFAEKAPEELEKWWQPDMVAQMLGDLRKAGLDARESATAPPQSSGMAPARTASGESRASEGFWVAVLPFRYSGNSADLRPLAEGLTDEIITGLSRFSYLRVIARGSTAKYSGESGDVRVTGRDLGARYVMEGSLRQAGAKLRLSIQLADSVSGTHLWAETYERAFAPDAIFDLQDDLVPRVVATVADQYGVLPRSMSEVLRSKSEGALTPHEAVLRTFTYFGRIGPEEHAIVRRILERAVREAPDHADSWAMLSMMYRGEFAQGYNAGPDPLDRALAAAQRAVDLAPTSALAHYALATVYFFRKERVTFRVEAERALTLNPLDASVKAYLGLLIAAAGEWDRGCEMVESAMQLNPNCPGYFYFARCWNAYRQGRYAEVLETVARINMPGYFHVPAIQAAALGQLGRQDEARKALQDLLALRPDFPAVIRQEYAKWYETEQIEQVVDGLRKAGMEFPQSPSQAASPD
jgi:TolB-like protein/Flp pilus assembly protein TadD